MATSKCLPKRKAMGWALISWGLRARERSGQHVGSARRILARVLAQHEEAATIWRIAAREGRFSSHRHLPCTRCPPQLLHAIREEDGAVAPRAVIATTGKEGMRTFNPDVVSIKVV